LHHFDFGCHFCKIKVHTAILRRFSLILPKSPEILPGFSPNQIFGGAVAPPPPAPVPSQIKRNNLSTVQSQKRLLKEEIFKSTFEAIPGATLQNFHKTGWIA